MTERSFLDTNVLVYTDDAAFPAKQAQAQAILDRIWNSASGVISTQVLQEYFAAATRKLGVPATTARRKIELFGRMDTVGITPDDILQAIDLHRLHGLSFWDALIVHAAQKGGCRVLYSEDMQHDRRFGDLIIVNPFIDTQP